MEAIEKSFGCMITIIAKKMTARFNQLLETNNVQIGQSGWAVLFQLWQEDGLTQQEISRRSGIAKPNISNYISKLERSNYVVRVCNPADKRNYHIHMTNLAKELKALCLQIRKQASDEISAALTPEERQVLLSLLHKVFDKGGFPSPALAPDP